MDRDGDRGTESEMVVDRGGDGGSMAVLVDRDANLGRWWHRLRFTELQIETDGVRDAVD